LYIAISAEFDFEHCDDDSLDDGVNELIFDAAPKDADGYWIKDADKSSLKFNYQVINHLIDTHSQNRSPHFPLV
jgi:hypothetical protein